MSRLRVPALVALLSHVFAAGCSSSTEAARSLAEFETQIESLRRDLSIPGLGAAITNGNQIVWSRGFGQSDAEAGVAATDTTSFHLASLTKTFASTVVMELVQSGRLNLDAPVSDFGITLGGQGTIRVRHLMTHTSDGVPGSAFSYNGDRFGLLDKVIQHVSGETFAQRLQRLILTPLALRHTAPNVADTASFRLTALDKSTFVRNLAQGYAPNGRTRIAYPTYFGTAAGLIGSAADVAQYSMAIDRNAFVTAATQAATFTPAISTRGDTLPYALGWFVQRIRGVVVQWHYGYWTGNSSLIIRVPARDIGFVLLANSDRLSRDTRLGFGDLLSSPAARVFLNAFVFGSASPTAP